MPKTIGLSLLLIGLLSSEVMVFPSLNVSDIKVP